MKSSQAKRRLKEMLVEAGFITKNPDPALAWDIFKRFQGEPVECTEEGVLFQCGVYDFTGEKLFYLDFVRQFSFDVIGDYHHMEQFHCTLTCAPNEQLLKTKKELWSFEFKTMDDYFKKVESLPEFPISMSQKVWKCEIYNERV